MKRVILPFLLLLITAIIYACGSGGNKKETPADTTAKAPATEPAQIKLLPAVGAASYETAEIGVVSPADGSKVEAGPVKFDFAVTNYELATQTIDAETRGCANSAKGQHIHLILDNQPYFAHYENTFERELEPGHYIMLAFLSRSYHESVKNNSSYKVTQFTVGDVDEEPADLSAPHMFYSRPKGTYKGKDTEKVLLDFFLVNTTLSADGNKVKATVNGQEFTIDSWQPYFLEGLPMGENTIKLELVDKDGNFIEGPFNRVERTVTLTEA